MRYVVILVVATLGYLPFWWLAENKYILLAWLVATAINGIAASVWHAVPKDNNG